MIKTLRKRKCKCCHTFSFQIPVIQNVKGIYKVRSIQSQSIVWCKSYSKKLNSLDIIPLPSLSRIGDVLKYKGLTYRRMGVYY